ncbi:MAG: hypothetical protein K6E85_09185 [Lachnospiraceae bacterium]|nr:hypothetical protein [Lachnospiraceae bacterium]
MKHTEDLYISKAKCSRSCKAGSFSLHRLVLCTILFIALVFGSISHDTGCISGDDTNGGSVPNALRYLLFSPSIQTSADTFFAYAYYKSGDYLSVNSAEELMVAAAQYPVIIKGTINKSKYVVVENGTPRLTTKAVYSSGNPQIFVYIPEITIGKRYSGDSEVNDLVRFVDSPVNNWILRTDYVISAGKHTGMTLSLYPSNEEASAEVSTADLKMQIWDGSTWRDVWVPEGSKYNIDENIKDEPDPDLSKCRGITATISDCSINGIVGQTLNDNTGFEISLTGAIFTQNARNRFHDVSGWLTTAPKNLKIMVNETGVAPYNKINVCYAQRKNGRTSLKVPQSASTSPIKLAVSLDDLTTAGGDCPWSGIKGEVVVNVNQNAVYNILTSGQFISNAKPMAISEKITGVFSQKSENGNITYLPVSDYSKTFAIYVPQNMIETDAATGKAYVPVTLTAPSGEFVIDGEAVTGIPTTSSVPTKVVDGIYRATITIPLKTLCATKVTNGRFGVKVGNVTLDQKNTYITYEIYESASELPEETEQPVEEDTGEEFDDGDNELPEGAAPDIWVNGKDNKKEEIYKKSLSIEAGSLIAEFPDECKYVVSVTDTSVDNASSAFSSGKGKKSNIAKAAYKKADDTIVVTAGKTEGTARVWLAAVDKQKKIQASGYFDVSVGMAPKKLYITKRKGAPATEAVKSISLNAGETAILYANAPEKGLAPHAKLIWTILKGEDCLEIEPSANTHSARITVTEPPSNGKVLKASIQAVNVESGKKVTCSVLIGNAVTEILGMEEDIELESAEEAAVEKSLGYTVVCVDGSPSTTDKIKVFTTAATEEGKGYTCNGRKFTLSSKSKVKVTYKNGEFSLKVPKKTKDGTKCRVLVVVTHADKMIEVFESGVITIGK